MSDADIEKLLKLITLGQQAFAELMIIISNHKAQAGKTEEQILNEAEQKTRQAMDIVAAL